MDTTKSEQLIKEYCRTQATARDRGLVARERDRLRFFLHAYVAEEWPRDLDRVDSEIIRDFLGGWFPRHVGGSKSDLSFYLTTFRRFYEFLYQAGHLSAAEYDDLIAVCDNREYFFARYDEYFRPVPDAWQDFAAGGPLRDRELAPALGAPIDRQLWILIRNLEHPEVPAPLDFALFLNYLGEHAVKLTPVHGRIPAPHLPRLNRCFSTPEELPPRAPMESCLRVNWFCHLALSLNLIASAPSQTIELRPRAEAFLDLDPDTRLAVMIDGSWNLLDWSRLNPAAARLARWAHQHRDGFAALLADLTPRREWTLDLDANPDTGDALLARYIDFHPVVTGSILFCLRQMGILDFRRQRSDQIKSLTMTHMGRQAMRLYARRASSGDKLETSPLAALQESLRG
jgi:hypothetical protein